MTVTDICLPNPCRAELVDQSEINVVTSSRVAFSQEEPLDLLNPGNMLTRLWRRKQRLRRDGMNKRRGPRRSALLFAVHPFLTDGGNSQVAQGDMVLPQSTRVL